MSADRFPIEVEDVLAGDHLRWEAESDAPRLASFEYVAVAASDVGPLVLDEPGAYFLLHRAEPDVSHLPTAADPRPGWAVLKDGTRIPGGAWMAHRLEPRAGGPAVHTLLTHERDIELGNLAGFVEAVLVRKTDLDALAAAYPYDRGTVVSGFLNGIEAKR